MECCDPHSRLLHSPSHLLVTYISPIFFASSPQPTVLLSPTSSVVPTPDRVMGGSSFSPVTLYFVIHSALLGTVQFMSSMPLYFFLLLCSLSGLSSPLLPFLSSPYSFLPSLPNLSHSVSLSLSLSLSFSLFLILSFSLPAVLRFVSWCDTRWITCTWLSHCKYKLSLRSSISEA